MNYSDIKDLDTPCYYYDMRVLQQILSNAKSEADKHHFNIHYALKANNNPEILSVIQSFGFGADCVSGQEVKLAIENNFTPNQIFFAGVGKTDKEIQLAIECNILCFNVESLQELSVIGHWAEKMNRTAQVALRINPNINADTHRYITTGLEENKFGISKWDIPKALEILKSSTKLKLVGLHFHIGSQITDLEVYRELCLKVNEWNTWFLNQGYDVPIVNVGGGLGINYEEPDTEAIPDFKAFFEIFASHLKYRENQKIYFELGRSLVGNCGSLLSRVLYIKEGKTRNFAIMDAGMTELLRPALYQAYHKIEKIGDEDQYNMEEYDIVGPICESSDYFGKSVKLPKLNRGDFLAIRSTGAYGEVMASRYNLREKFGYFFKR